MLGKVADAYAVDRDRWAGEQMDAFDAAPDLAIPEKPEQQAEAYWKAEWDRVQAATCAVLQQASARTVARVSKTVERVIIELLWRSDRCEETHRKAHENSI